MDLQPETILHDRYQIIEKLGQGGMGAVYLAWDQSLETRVAVKSNFNPAPESVDQFLKEAQLLAGLRHPNLPRVTDYFVIGKEQFLVMDFIPGDDLGKRLSEEGAQSLEDVLSWAGQLGDALAYMHRQQPPVTHRDIKPANIKLTPDGQVILVDFGIAKVDSVQAHTATGAAGYTPGYAPPEQYGQGRTGPYSDQFSLAATLYALLTRAKPADSIQRVLGKAALLPIQEVNPNIPRHINDALLKAMSLQTEDRFNSVTEFMKALTDPDFHLPDHVRELLTSTLTQKVAGPTVLANQPVLPTVVGTEIQKKRSRAWWIVGVLGGLVGLCMVVVVLLLFIFPQSPIYLLGSRAATATPASFPTETIQDAEAEEVEVPPVRTMQPEVEPTETTESSMTPTSEMVGESGIIAFASDRGEDGIVQVWTMRVIRDAQGEVQTDSLTQLTFDDGDKDQPVWSPDGAQLAYVAPGEGANGNDIWVMDADGSNQQNITAHAGDEFDPAWSPDGQRIAFTHHLRDEGSKPVYALTWIKPDGSERARLSLDFVEWDPTFSPDGKWLLYVISAKSHNYFYFRSAADGFETPKGFDLRDLFGQFGEVSDPAWALTGNQFAYTKHSGSKTNIVLVTFSEMMPNGVHQPKEFVLTDSNAETDPAWSSDSRWLAFTSNRDGDAEIYLMPTTGRPQLNLTEREGIDRSPDWLPLVMGE